MYVCMYVCMHACMHAFFVAKNSQIYLAGSHVMALFVHVGLNITEVAHDHEPQVTRFVTEELLATNSYDTWHGKLYVSTNSAVMSSNE